MPDLPVYQSHKTVAALKIVQVINRDSAAPMLVPASDDHVAFTVSPEYIAKHNPVPGGYWVKYGDGNELTPEKALAKSLEAEKA